MEDIDDRMETEKLFGETAEDCCSQKCNRVIPQTLIQSCRDSFHEMTNAEQDIVILVHLKAHKEHKDLLQIYQNQRRYRGNKDVKQRRFQKYFFMPLEICKRMYMYIHDIGKKRYQNLQKHFTMNYIAPRHHGLAGSAPYRDKLITPEIIEEVVTFIENYAAKFGDGSLQPLGMYSLWPKKSKKVFQFAAQMQ